MKRNEKPPGHRSQPSSGSQSQPLKGPPLAGPLLPWLLAALAPMARTRVKQLLQRGQIAVNGIVTTQFDQALQPGDHVQLVRRESSESLLADAKLTILHLDDETLVIDKPPGLLTVATDDERNRTAFALLQAYLTERKMGRPYVVHRLDRETSGVLLFARSAAVRDRLQAGWREVGKTYLGIVEGAPSTTSGTIKTYLTEGKDLRVRSGRRVPTSKLAVTHYQVLKTRGQFSLVELRLETGRKHQLRVHMAELGCPILGDKVYGAKTNPLNRLALHAWRLTFLHPKSSKEITVESPLPAGLERFLG